MEDIKSRFATLDNDSWRLEDGHQFFVTGGNASIMVCGRIIADSCSGCPRRLVLRNRGIEDHKDESTLELFEKGYEFEREFAQRLVSKGTIHIPDYKRKVDLGMNTVMTLSTDFYLPDDKAIVETKCCTNKSRIKDTFMHGHYKVQNVIQVLNYMTAMPEVEKAFLVYGAGIDYNYKWKDVRKEFKKGDIYTFIIERISGGGFTITDTQTKVKTVLSFRESHIHKYLEYMLWVFNESIADTLRPTAHGEFADPCKYCSFNTVCDDESNTGDLETFLTACKKKLEADALARIAGEAEVANPNELDDVPL
jgi:hypothetical protein